MEVILLKDLSIGDKNSVIKVSRGHARNFLFPNGFALEATKANIKHVESINAQRKKKLEKEKAEVEKVAKKINDHKEIVIEAKGSESGALFGSVTNPQIAEIINKTHGLEIDRRRILVKNLREAGVAEVPVKLTFGITATAKIKVELVVEKAKDERKKPRARKKKAEEIVEEMKDATLEEEVKEEAPAKETDEKAPVAEAKEEAKPKAKKKAAKAEKTEEEPKEEA